MTAAVKSSGEVRAKPRVQICAVAGPWTGVASKPPRRVKQAIFHIGMLTVGRWCRTFVRRLLQRRLITGRNSCPLQLTRQIEILPPERSDFATLRVTDTIEMTDRRLRVRRMAYGTDHQSVYVAAAGVYQDAVLADWTDLATAVDELNERRRVVITREL